MKPTLLPVGEQSKNSIDYTHGVITRHYTAGDSKYYFTLHPEHYPDGDALVPTGRYLVVLLSSLGISHFYLEMDETGKYFVDSEDDEVATNAVDSNESTSILPDDLLEEINQEIISLDDYSEMMNTAISDYKFII